MAAAACLVQAVLADLVGEVLVGADFGAGNWRIKEEADFVEFGVLMTVDLAEGARDGSSMSGACRFG